MRLPEKNQIRISAGVLCHDGLASFEAIYGGRWSLISRLTATNESSRWQLIRRGEESQEARLALPEPQLLAEGVRPSVGRRLQKIEDAAGCRRIDLLTHCFCFVFPLAAPSTVSIMHQVSRTVDSITLSWSQPDQPNGVILDYELQYYEKVVVVPHCLLAL